MDWDYILSISPEDLTEEEKDELYNMVTWFNSESEDLNLTKTSALLRLSQEILKYKGEQVEVLLHKLDELATQQGEEEMKKFESDTDARSSKSRKSSSIEFENLEQKYLELRSKYKKQIKTNEKNGNEISKLKKKLADLDQEKNRLISEMQLMNQDDNQSDISESFKEQHKELVQTLHNKNKQISNLLHDIEETEKENVILREKLATVRDELTNATKELTLSAVNHKAIKIELEESSEIIKKLTAENELLHDEAREALEQKRYFEREMEEFTEEVNVRVDEWKKILDEKEKEIDELKSRQVRQSSIRSSLSSLPQDKDQTHVATLNKILGERETQLLEVKAKLQEAVQEMEETTRIIKELTTEKEGHKTQIHNLTGSVKELKKQLKAAHERCQNLQDDLTHTEEIVQEKDADLKEILDMVKSEGDVDLAENLGQIQQLKGQNRMQEKQIMDLVKAANKLQENCDQYEKEIEVLRDRLGISPDEIVSTTAIPFKQRQHKKELISLRKRIEQFEEERLELKTQIHQQNRTISGLSNQLLEIGENPEVENLKLIQAPDAPSKTEIKALVEENEALRKGLHEVLDSVNLKKETTVREVKSETFEKLLRALDARHVAGWYHPAMRLQAELHNQEGINAELREQLRLMRLEKSQKSEDDEKIQSTSDLNVLDSAVLSDAIEGRDLASLNKIQKSLQDLLVKLDRDSDGTAEIETKLLSYKQSFVEIHQQIGLLYAEYQEEVKSGKEELAQCRDQLTELEESNAVKEAKIDLLIKECSGEEPAVSKALELATNNVVLNRKCVYLENEIKWLHNRVTKLQEDFSTAQATCLNKINNLANKNKVLAINVNTLTNQLEEAVDPLEFGSLRKDFDNLTIKYRVVLTDFSKLGRDQELETKMLEESRKVLEVEKVELKNRVADLCEKLHTCENSSEPIDERIETLCKKLAATEMNEITERQRANHINNLYELVKEQFQKSEETCRQLEAHNKVVVQRNLLLQEQLKDLEGKVASYVDVATLKSLQGKYDELLLNYEQLKGGTAVEATSKSDLEPTFSTKWSLAREEELLSLKHQIVDLQAASDDKMQIARLTTDLNHLRLQENERSCKIEALTKNLDDCEAERNDLIKKLEIKTLEMREKEIEFKRKIGALRSILEKQKLQYLGCVPLVSEEEFIDNVKRAIIDKHEAFINLHNAQICANESSILKEQYETELKTFENLLKSNSGSPDQIRELLNGLQEKRMLQFSELKYRRQFNLKEKQLQHVFDRVKIQDDQIVKLEEELFNLHKNYNVSFDSELDPPPVVIEQEKLVKNDPPMVKITKSKEIQTVESSEDATPTSNEDKIASLRGELMNVSTELSAKNRMIEQFKSKIAEQEMNISLFRKQLGDKQSQITFYERHILELQSKKEVTTTIPVTNEELLSLKCSIKTFQENVKDKDEEILRYQSLLKEDRDKHSLAASLMRDELKMLQKCLADEKQKYSELKSSLDAVHPSKAVLEQYFVQVHSLEDELAELRTKVSGLESQLQASRGEAVRWRALANDRLESMQQLGKDLDDVHRSEIIAYKNDSEKWREEVTNLKQMISKYRSEMAIDFDFQKLLKEKDDKIHELTVLLRSAKSESRKAIDRPDLDTADKLNELESTKEQLLKEHEAIKKRFDQLLTRERSAREEIRDLRGKLMKKPILSARSDKSDRSIKEQLQKKVTSLENEIVELKQNLERQVAINESHRIKISEDFDRWNKQKHWQQLAEKLKDKLKTKEVDLDKLQQTCAGYRILIERLEREKYNLESRIKSLKTGHNQISSNEIEMLQMDNMKLIAENEALTSKLEMQQHHAGGLGAAMLQEKLEAQERKIAILELSNKGTGEVRSELDRLQHTISSLQKSNLRLEAENLELKVDVERFNKETPHLRQQIQHLENYIEVLKNETVQKDTTETAADPRAAPKKISELERTIFVLKRVVEKLQAENKRLGSGEKLKRDYHRLKEQYCESLQKVSRLEQELSSVNSVENKHLHDKLTALSDELTEVKEQLEQKSHLLGKVRVLLQRAAMKEKTLLQEIAELRGKRESPESGSGL